MKTKWKQLAVAVIAVAVVVASGIAYAALSSKVILTIQTQYTGTSDLGSTINTLSLDRAITLTSGDGASEADVIFHDERTLADDANEVLDFHAGTLSDPLGAALTMDIIKVLYIKNTSTTTDLKIGGGTDPIPLFANATDILSIKPGGTFLYSAPDATGLSAIDGNDLNILHGGGGTADVEYEIIVIGVD